MCIHTGFLFIIIIIFMIFMIFMFFMISMFFMILFIFIIFIIFMIYMIVMILMPNIRVNWRKFVDMSNWSERADRLSLAKKVWGGGILEIPESSGEGNSIKLWRKLEIIKTVFILFKNSFHTTSSNRNNSFHGTVTSLLHRSFSKLALKNTT